MAIAHTTAQSGETENESLLYQLFTERLSDKFHFWHHIQSDQMEEAVDWLLLHPLYGIWILQTKDWGIDQIREIDQEYCWIQVEEEETLQRNPLREARDKYYAVRNLLTEQKGLLHPEGQFEGNLLFAVHHLVVFTQITGEQLGEKKIEDVFPLHQRITADEITPGRLEQTNLEDLLIDKRSPRFLNHRGLTPEQITVIDNALNPGETAAVSHPSSGAEADDVSAEPVTPAEQAGPEPPETPREAGLPEPSTEPGEPSPQPPAEAEQLPPPPLSETPAETPEAPDRSAAFSEAPPEAEKDAPDTAEESEPEKKALPEESPVVDEEPAEEDFFSSWLEKALPPEVAPPGKSGSAERLSRMPRFSSEEPARSSAQEIDNFLHDILVDIVDLNEKLLQRIWSRD